jgi:hypothetical protein
MMMMMMMMMMMACRPFRWQFHDKNLLSEDGVLGTCAIDLGPLVDDEDGGVMEPWTAWVDVEVRGRHSAGPMLSSFTNESSSFSRPGINWLIQIMTCRIVDDENGVMEPWTAWVDVEVRGVHGTDSSSLVLMPRCWSIIRCLAGVPDHRALMRCSIIRVQPAEGYRVSSTAGRVELELQLVPLVKHPLGVLTACVDERPYPLPMDTIKSYMTMVSDDSSFVCSRRRATARRPPRGAWSWSYSSCRSGRRRKRPTPPAPTRRRRRTWRSRRVSPAAMGGGFDGDGDGWDAGAAIRIRRVSSGHPPSPPSVCWIPCNGPSQRIASNGPSRMRLTGL